MLKGVLQIYTKFIVSVVCHHLQPVKKLARDRGGRHWIMSRSHVWRCKSAERNTYKGSLYGWCTMAVDEKHNAHVIGTQYQSEQHGT